MLLSGRLDRRRLLGLMGAGGAGALLAACGGSRAPAGQPTAGATAGAAGDWNAVVAAAKSEGKVSINTFPGNGNMVALQAFGKAYPQIKLEQTSLVASALTPRILQERKAGVYTWDVLQMPTTTALQVLQPAGVYSPIRPLITQPDVIDEKVWSNGFASGFDLTDDKQLCYAATTSRTGTVFINTDQVNPDEMKSVTDLLNPKWKGKVVCTDTRISGSSFFPWTLARLKLGDDVMRQFFTAQQPVITQDGTQAANFLAHGNYPIGIGLVTTIIGDYQKQGIARNIKQVLLPEFDSAGPSANGILWFVNNAPHPNAARVYINWFLSKDGQASWASNARDNSRRLDVSPGDPNFVVPPGAVLPDLNEQKYLPELAKTQDLAKELIK
jgi:iron(III) transport system substrate-binding protein